MKLKFYHKHLAIAKGNIRSHKKKWTNLEFVEKKLIADILPEMHEKHADQLTLLEGLS